MARWAYLLIVFTLLAAWVSAQNPVPAQPQLSAEDKLRLLKANSTLIENLVNDGVAISSADTAVNRVEHCRNASRSLVNAIQQAATAEDAERVAVLTDLFRDFVREGLLPTLDDAKRDVPAESPDGKRLRDLRLKAAGDLNDLKKASSTGKLSDSQRVKDAIKQLDEVSEALK